MKAVSIEDKVTGFFKPGCQRDNGEIVSGPFPAKQFATEGEAIAFAKPYVEDMIKMKGRIFRLRPHRLIFPLTAVGIGVWFGNFGFTLAMALLAGGLWWILKNDESWLGLRIDALFGYSNKGVAE